MFWLFLADPPPLTSSHQLPALITSGDYPEDALMRGETGTVIARIVVDKIGKTESCSVVYSSRSQSLDRATCRLLEKRARFKPALHDGRPIYSVMMTPPIMWFTLDKLPTTTVKLRPDSEIGISRAPDGVVLPIDVSVDYVISADGRITSCDASAASENEQLVAIACDASNLPKPVAMKNKSGELVDVLYNWKAHFVQGTP